MDELLASLGDVTTNRNKQSDNDFRLVLHISATKFASVNGP
jgi:hypothetical protein